MDWNNKEIYLPGAFVTHGGKCYRKADDGDNSPPDDIGGGWTEVLVDSAQLTQYQAIEASFSSYEQRVADHQAAVAAAKASAKAKLTALGLTVEELQALGV